MAKIGTAYVEIKPDLTGFARELKEKLTAVNTPIVRVKVTPDLRGFTKDLREGLAGRNTPNLRVKVVPDFRGFITAARTRIKEIERLLPPVRVKMDVDTRVVDAALAGAARRAVRGGKNLAEDASKGFFSGLATAFKSTQIGSFLVPLFSSPGGAILGVIAASALFYAGAWLTAFAGGLIGLAAGLSLVALGVFGQKDDPEIGKKAKEVGKSFMDKLKEATKSFKIPILQSLDIGGKAINDFVDKLKPAFDQLAPFLPELTKGLAGFLDEIAKALSDPQVVDTMKDLIVTLGKEMPKIGKAIGDIFRTLGEHQDIVNWVMAGGLDGVARSFRAIGVAIGAAAIAVETFRTELRLLKIGFDVVSSTVSTTWSYLWPNLVSIFRDAWETIKGTFDAAKLAILTSWSDFVSEVQTRAFQIVQFFQQLPGRIWAALSSLPALLGMAATQAMQALANGINGGINAAVGAARSIPGRVQAAVGNLGGLLYGAGQDVVRGLWNGISSMGGWLAGRVREFISYALQHPVDAMLGRHSPSKYFMEVGVDVVKGLSIGIVKESPNVPAIPIPGVEAPTMAGFGRAAINVFVRIGDTELNDIIDSRVVVSDDNTARMLLAGRSGL